MSVSSDAVVEVLSKRSTAATKVARVFPKIAEAEAVRHVLIV